MSMRIEKKIWPEFFNEVASGKKSFDVRLADWECQPGDTLILREWDPKTKDYTGRKTEKTVTIVVKTKDMKYFQQNEIGKYGYQVIGLK